MHDSHPDSPADRVLCLVGDRLAGAGRPEEVIIPLSQFVTDLRAGRYDAPSTLPRLIAGQGLGRYEVDHLYDELGNRGVDGAVIERAPDPVPARRQQVHKARQRNVLVAGLHQVDDVRYQAVLRVDGENELLLDHTTGRHLQGMLVMEATRQMAIATAESRFQDSLAGGGYQWAAGSWRTEFRRFLFPLQVLLECRITESDVSSRARLNFHMVVSFVQAGATAVTSTVEFTAFDQVFLSRAESVQAALATRGMTTGINGEEREFACS
jgi:A-factor biosynthesis hotdog domain